VSRPGTIKLSLRAVQQYVFSKHHVAPGSQANQVSQVAQSLFGLHAARLPTPYVTLHSRLTNYQTQDLRHSLLVRRELIKLRCMRRTLHIVPLNLAPVVHQATRTFRVAGCIRTLRSLQISSTTIEAIRQIVIEILQALPRSAKDIHTLIAEYTDRLTLHRVRTTQNAMDIRAILKLLWEEGTICYINRSERWDAEVRFFGLTTQEYPQLHLDSLSENDAIDQLIYFHIQQYGPVSAKDIAWWSGLGNCSVNTVLAKFLDQRRLVQVTATGIDTPMFMTLSDYEIFTAFQPNQEQWLNLLAYEDPSLKGYFETRCRYVDRRYYDLLFNQIGEARASIVFCGQIIGVWDWDKKTQTIHTRPFEPLSKNQSSWLVAAQTKLEEQLQEDALQGRLF